jgi:hypothetical protein
MSSRCILDCAFAGYIPCQHISHIQITMDTFRPMADERGPHASAAATLQYSIVNTVETGMI